MKIKQAIILAGGFGTRLQGVIKDIPKPMADINGKPFLEYVLNDLVSKGIEQIILSIGYKSQAIKDYFDKHSLADSITYSVEETPLGTGGGIKKSLRYTTDKDVLIVNGDTFFNVDVQNLYAQHLAAGSDFTLALKEMEDCSRYGRVLVDGNFKTTGFEEKGHNSKGFINGGVFIINKDILEGMPETFSLEKDFLEKKFSSYNVYGYPTDGYFIDIGVPEEYERAKKELKITL
jgi:D-glycero-alpha-D-manno-heptose 1-phosphate guanylyltransferase